MHLQSTKPESGTPRLPEVLWTALLPISNELFLSQGGDCHNPQPAEQDSLPSPSHPQYS